MYTLLIVEDEPLERELLEDIIRKEYPQITEIDSVDNGIDALRMVQKNQEDILLVDINIPGISGLELIKELSEYRFPGQILITTAYDSFSYAKQALKYGAVGYLLKPILDDELREYLEKCFQMIDEHRKKEQLSTGIVSICSYAQHYLVRDFFHGNLQEQAMTNAYGWPKDGNLQASVLRLHFSKNLSVFDKNELSSVCQDIYQPFYRVLFSAEESDVFLMLQPDTPHNLEFLTMVVWAFSVSAAQMLWEKFPGLWITSTKICFSYQELHEELPALLSDKMFSVKGLSKQWQQAVTFEPVPEHEIYPPRERKIKIQKALQRLREGNIDNAIVITVKATVVFLIVFTILFYLPSKNSTMYHR